MADKHPYSSGSLGLLQMVTQLRKSFPPNNETYVLNILRFLGVLDTENKKTSESAQLFNQHEDADFKLGFSKLVEKAYHELFALHGDGTWGLPTNKLISFFRNHDGSGDIVGKRQATTFQALANLSGKILGVPAQAAAKSASNGSKVTNPTKSPAMKKIERSANVLAEISLTANNKSSPSPMALTVRVEVNLPAGGDQKTYDAIFKSIRENLLNGRGV